MDPNKTKSANDDGAHRGRTPSKSELRQTRSMAHKRRLSVSFEQEVQRAEDGAESSFKKPCFRKTPKKIKVEKAKEQKAKAKAKEQKAKEQKAQVYDFHTGNSSTDSMSDEEDNCSTGWGPRQRPVLSQGEASEAKCGLQEEQNISSEALKLREPPSIVERSLEWTWTPLPGQLSKLSKDPSTDVLTSQGAVSSLMVGDLGTESKSKEKPKNGAQIGLDPAQQPIDHNSETKPGSWTVWRDDGNSGGSWQKDENSRGPLCYDSGGSSRQGIDQVESGDADFSNWLESIGPELYGPPFYAEQTGPDEAEETERAEETDGDDDLEGEEADSFGADNISK